MTIRERLLSGMLFLGSVAGGFLTSLLVERQSFPTQEELDEFRDRSTRAPASIDSRETGRLLKALSADENAEESRRASRFLEEFVVVYNQTHAVSLLLATDDMPLSASDHSDLTCSLVRQLLADPQAIHSGIHVVLVCVDFDIAQIASANAFSVKLKTRPSNPP